MLKYNRQSDYDALAVCFKMLAAADTQIFFFLEVHQ